MHTNTRTHIHTHTHTQGNELYHEMIESGVIKLDGPGSKAALVYGQMNEPPGASPAFLPSQYYYCVLCPDATICVLILTSAY